ncbi:TetR/AcrR family transcriptional regulator [Cryobacterium psychrophilum]|uniref:TetR/AcrR family transcriptional regulator n=1 Tax=Cryobacterium psychrophilum TaxID=41988 RepID=A0A4Y8KNG9_9MICO|nr:TetR/AcrR family transcriptional regulator [Cryobacterium psychrophilum]TDW29062.1 TetR family transcriptional regulator [Cryobacterium psychrophilum]TFD79725.1 TetR/AcrR family transcriptional regulator [Cryobacterium psychrophilum]
MSAAGNVTIGRPRLFDEEAVLVRLTELFWRQGYTRTSMTDIVQTSGVQKPSLYRTFGTKEELFATVLRRYLAGRIQMFAGMIEQAGTGVEGVHTFLNLFEADAVSKHGRDGCLMVMASNELRGTLPGYEFAADYRRAMRDVMATLFAWALPHGGPEVVQVRTDLFTAYLLGLQVIMRSGADGDEIHRYVNALHVTVDSW